jgi:hypothetical protein
MIQRPIAKSLLGTRLCQAATTMQKLIGTLLSLSLSCQAAHLTPQERILAMPPQSFIEVKLVDKTRVRGRLDKIDTDGFIVTTPAADQASIIERRISFADVKSVKQPVGTLTFTWSTPAVSPGAAPAWLRISPASADRSPGPLDAQVWRSSLRWRR